MAPKKKLLLSPRGALAFGALLTSPTASLKFRSIKKFSPRRSLRKMRGNKSKGEKIDGGGGKNLAEGIRMRSVRVIF